MAGFWAAFPNFAANGATTERLVVDRFTGLAIHGYDPVDVARGVTVAGNPLFWVVAGERLYLFGLEANRDAFAADPARFLEQATGRWPELERSLAQ